MDEPSDQEPQFARMWAEFCSKMVSAGLGASPTTPPPKAARDMRDASLGAMSQTLDQFMRTPQYLEAMRDWMDSALSVRKQYQEFLSRVRQETQGIASEDVDAIMRSLRHMESRVLDRMDAISARLDAISQRMDSLDAEAGSGGNGHGRAAGHSAKPPAQGGKPL